KAFPLAGFAFYINIRKEIHLYYPKSRALTGFTTPTAYIKTEPTRFVTSYHSFRCLCKQLSYFRENISISSRVRAWCSSNRGLVYIYNLINMLKAFNFFIRLWLFYSIKEVCI